MTNLTETMYKKQLDEAVNRMINAGFNQNIISEFSEKETILCSDNGILVRPLTSEESLMVKDFCDEWNGVVFHIIKSAFFYSILYVSKHEQEWESDMLSLHEMLPFVYVVNTKCPDFSEFGHIEIKIMQNGIISRVN